MPAERTTMRQVREVLRLRTSGVGLNEIARRVGVAPSTVRLTLKRLASAGLSWPLPAEMTDTALETALCAAAGTKQGHRRQAGCRFRRRHGAGDRRPAYRPGPSGADFRRRHGRLQLHLCRGELDPGAG